MAITTRQFAMTCAVLVPAGSHYQLPVLPIDCHGSAGAIGSPS